MYNMIRLHLKLSRVGVLGESIQFDGNEFHNFTAEGQNEWR